MSQNSSSQLKNEIFRHLRPLWYNKDKHELTPQPNGGISFLLVPTELGTYDYWIYPCPSTASFSSKQSVKSLRSTYLRGVKPWGSIVFSADDPLIHQAVKDLIGEKFDIPTEVAHQALGILIINAGQECKKREAEESMKEKARVAYEES